MKKSKLNQVHQLKTRNIMKKDKVIIMDIITVIIINMMIMFTLKNIPQLKKKYKRMMVSLQLEKRSQLKEKKTLRNITKNHIQVEEEIENSMEMVGKRSITKREKMVKVVIQDLMEVINHKALGRKTSQQVAMWRDNMCQRQKDKNNTEI